MKSSTINIHYNPTCYLAREIFVFKAGGRKYFRLCLLLRNYARRCWEDTLKISFISYSPESDARPLIASPWHSVLVFVENREIIPDYLRRFSHTSKEISTHFRVRLRIRHKTGESQIFHPMFLSRVCPFLSSAPSPPVFWVCHLAWCSARRSQSRSRRVRPRLWSRLWPWWRSVAESPNLRRGGGFSTSQDGARRIRPAIMVPSEKS